MMCVIRWLVIVAATVQGSLTGKVFFVPCLGTDLFLRMRVEEKRVSKGTKKEKV